MQVLQVAKAMHFEFKFEFGFAEFHGSFSVLLRENP